MMFVISIYSCEINKPRGKLVFPGKCCPLRGKDILLDFSQLYLEIYAEARQISPFWLVDFINSVVFVLKNTMSDMWACCDTA